MRVTFNGRSGFAVAVSGFGPTGRVETVLTVAWNDGTTTDWVVTRA